jgi:hypothetical protein
LRLDVNVLPFLWILHAVDAVNASNQTATFDLNYALEEDVLDGSSDEEPVDEQG